MKTIGIGCLLLFCLVTASASSIDDNRKGVEALQAGRFDEAINCLSDAYRDAGNNEVIKNNLAVAYNNAALDYNKKGDFDKARVLMQKAYDLDPRSAKVKRNYAFLLTNESIRRYNEKKVQDVVGLLTDALTYDDSLAETHVLLGQVYYDRDEYAGAQQHWEKALRLNPSLAALQQKLDKLNKELAGDYKLRDQEKYHFKVRYEGVEMWTASRDVLDMLEDAYNNSGRLFGVYPDQPLTVIIYTQEQFQTISGKPDWFAGLYDGKIRLRRSDVEGDKKLLRQIVYHEYMHAFVHYVAGSTVPPWLNEGIAQCYETMPDKPALDPFDKQFLKQRLANDAPAMGQIDQMFLSRDSQDDVRFAYAYSKAFVNYLIEKGWDYNIKNLLDELGKGSSADDAFNKIFFRNVQQMRDDWLNELKYSTAY
jgi:tetratricopeptide (TPR) repeat protein